MLVSTKGRYALRIMIDLAEHQTDGYVPLRETAARQNISEKYLEGILKILVKHKFLSGLRGKGGGYRLTKAPEEYTIASILRLTENSLAPVACLESEEKDCHLIYSIVYVCGTISRLFFSPAVLCKLTHHILKLR